MCNNDEEQQLPIEEEDIWAPWLDIGGEGGGA